MASVTARPRGKSICVILDAMVVIEAHSLGIWDNLLDKIDAVIPSTVVRDEAFYFDAKMTGKRGAILISQRLWGHILNCELLCSTGLMKRARG
jgi:hypothetical protein